MRLRDLGIIVGQLMPGRHNAITDVPHVRVGHREWVTDTPFVQRTGVTVVIPSEDVYHWPIPAASDVLNGFGELTGQATIAEWGVLATPIVLSNTRSVGKGYEAIMQDFFSHPAYRPTDALPLPVVGECDDSFLNDYRKAIPNDVYREAFAQAVGGPVAEGAVGAGTGMHLFGYKGGIGTASRRVELEQGVYAVGVLVNTNFGRPYQLRLIEGLRAIYPPRDVPRDGSCIGIVATDAPLWPHELKRLARRIGLGLSRTGSVGNDTSGELFLAFSTASPTAYARLAGEGGMLTGRTGGSTAPMNRIFDAVVEATEEAVWNALLQATTVTGIEGHVLSAFTTG